MQTCTACEDTLPAEAFFKDLEGNPLPRCKTCLINALHPGYKKKRKKAPTLREAASEAARERTDRLCSHQQDVLAAYNSGKKYKDIAAEMGVPLNTVKTWISRARSRTLAGAYND
jgi:DNA-directed RNA polymerase specialized sigma24 family protein